MSRFIAITCRCGAVKAYPASQVNRSARRGHELFCSRACAGIAKRTSAEAKAAYQREYHARYRAEKPTPHDYWAAYYAEHRQESIAAASAWYAAHREHVSERGRKWRARKKFGPFADAYLIWLESRPAKFCAP